MLSRVLHAIRRLLKFFGCSRLAYELCGHSAQPVYRTACAHCRISVCVCESVLAAHDLAFMESARSPAGSDPDCGPFYSMERSGALQQALVSSIQRLNAPAAEFQGALVC